MRPSIGCSIEPLIAARHLPAAAATAIDIGSGGGSPAIPLALAAPRLQLRMVESKTRKAVFLREAIRELNLGRASVETSRFEELLARPELHEGLDVVTIRAVRVEQRTLMSLQAFLKPGGQLFLFRGPAGDMSDGVAPPLRMAGDVSARRIPPLAPHRLTQGPSRGTVTLPGARCQVPRCLGCWVDFVFRDHRFSVYLSPLGTLGT